MNATGNGKVAMIALGASAALSVATAEGRARADDPSVGPDQPTEATAGGGHVIDRTWLYADDGRVASPLTVVGTTSVSYTSVTNQPSRIVAPFDGCAAPCNRYNAFAGNTADPGAVLGAGGEVGLLPRLSVMAVGQVGVGGLDNAGMTAGLVAGLRLQVLSSDRQNVHLVLSGGYLREAWQGPIYDAESREWSAGSPNGDNAAWLQAGFSVDVQRLRLATTLHGEHVFSDGRDPFDLMVQAGASYRLVGDFRAGVEYVGQDVEETFTSGAEGGSRHFVGPIASLQLLHDRLTVVAGPSVGLTARSPDFLGRAALSYGF
jgi:hypothetical protein